MEGIKRQPNDRVLAFSVDQHTEDALRTLAKVEGRSLSQTIRLIILRYLNAVNK